MNVNYKVYDLVSCAMNGTVASRAFATDGDRCNVVVNWIMNFVSSDVYMGLVYSIDVASVWKELKSTYDKVDGSMIFNLLQKISSIKQGGSSVADYYHRLNSLWREFDALTKLHTCTCDANEELSVRSALLTRDPLSEVKDAYTIVFRKESHRGIPEPFSVTESQINATSFAAKGFNVNKRNNFSSNNNNKGEILLIINRGPNPNPSCKNYGMIGHTTERCYELIGHPPRFNKVANPIKQSTFKQYFNANSDIESNDKQHASAS
ncbi:ribonuclease H-like domain-containing protein [Tanacetum coccineum]